MEKHKHQFELTTENISIDNIGIDTIKGAEGFKYNLAYFMVLLCECGEKEYKRLVFE